MSTGTSVPGKSALHLVYFLQELFIAFMSHEADGVRSIPRRHATIAKWLGIGYRTRPELYCKHWASRSPGSGMCPAHGSQATPTGMYGPEMAGPCFAVTTTA